MKDQAEQYKAERREELKKFEKALSKRDEEWKEQRSKVQGEVGNLREQVELPREQIVISITEEMEKRVVKKVQQVVGNNNPDMANMDDKLENMSKLLEREEKRMKMRNIIISGLTVVSTLPIKQQINEFLNSHFSVNDPVSDAFLVGAEKKSVKVILEQVNDKTIIMKEKKNALGGSNVFINPDLTSREAKIGKHLRQTARAYRGKGGKAFIKGLNICLEDVWWYWEDRTGKLVKVPKVSKKSARLYSPMSTNVVNNGAQVSNPSKNAVTGPPASFSGTPGVQTTSS